MCLITSGGVVRLRSLKRGEGLWHGEKSAGRAGAGEGNAGCYLNRQQICGCACVTFLKMARGA